MALLNLQLDDGFEAAGGVELLRPVAESIGIAGPPVVGEVGLQNQFFTAAEVACLCLRLTEAETESNAEAEQEQAEGPRGLAAREPVKQGSAC